jgi:hypothetical protein
MFYICIICSDIAAAQGAVPPHATEKFARAYLNEWYSVWRPKQNDDILLLVRDGLKDGYEEIIVRAFRSKEREAA